MSRSPALAAMAAIAAIALTACSGSDGADPYGYGGASGEVAGPQTLAAPEGTVLTANSTAQLGTVVIDGLGWTLYRFDDDTAEPPTSNCAGDCATAWPPVLAEPGTPLSLEGVAQEAIGTITRPDGGVQLTIGGWPVYRYAADSAPGATDGHGVGEKWFAVNPEGGRAAAPA
jgi:predicted lipoprotein with Yx(FWY)xxD motif